MRTAFDRVTMAIFCLVAVLLLHRSVGPAVPRDHRILYVPPALGCAAANWLGNGGWRWSAGVVLAATLAYILLLLKPFSAPR